MGICEGRICVVTGAGRGIGREYALLLAREGARVVVNDLGGDMDGAGTPTTGPALEVVEEIRAMGGEAVANGDDVSSFDGAARMVRTAVESFGDLHVLVNNAGILRDRMLVNMTEQEWDSVIGVHLKGTFAPSHHAANLLAGAGQGRRRRRGRPPGGPHHQHHLGVGDLRQPGPDQLRRGQGRHRLVLLHRRAGAGPLRRHGQRGRARGADPA